MSRIRVLGSSTSGRFTAQTDFVPFSGTGHQLKAGKRAQNEWTGTPAAYTPVQHMSGFNMETLILQLQAATAAMEATTSAIMTLHNKSEVHENEIKNLKEKVHRHTHSPPEPFQTAATGSVPHNYGGQEEIVPQSVMNCNETSNLSVSSGNPHFQDLNDPLEDVQTLPKTYSPPGKVEETSYTFSEDHVTEDSSALSDSHLATEATYIMTKQIIKLVQNEQKDNRLQRAEERREHKFQAEERQREWDMKYALKNRNQINSLTLKDLRQPNSVGWGCLRQYIREVEQSCPRDSIRVAVAQITLEQELLKYIQLNEHTWRQVTWAEVKRKLRKKVPKIKQYLAEARILQTHMNMTEDIEVFTTTMESEYEETCKLLEVDELDIPLNEILETTVTANMCPEGRKVFGSALRKNPGAGIKKIEEAFRDQAFKEEMFLSIKPTPTHPEINQSKLRQKPLPIVSPRVNLTGHYHNKEECRNSKPKCQYWQKGCCNFGRRCWFQHQP